MSSSSPPTYGPEGKCLVLSRDGFDDGVNRKTVFQFSSDGDAALAAAALDTFSDWYPTTPPDDQQRKYLVTASVNGQQFRMTFTDQASIDVFDKFTEKACVSASNILRDYHKPAGTPAPAPPAAFVVICGTDNCYAFATREDAEAFVWQQMKDSGKLDWTRKVDVIAKKFIDEWYTTNKNNVVKIVTVSSNTTAEE